MQLVSSSSSPPPRSFSAFSEGFVLQDARRAIFAQHCASCSVGALRNRLKTSDIRTSSLRQRRQHLDVVTMCLCVCRTSLLEGCSRVVASYESTAEIHAAARILRGSARTSRLDRFCCVVWGDGAPTIVPRENTRSAENIGLVAGGRPPHRSDHPREAVVHCRPHCRPTTDTC